MKTIILTSVFFLIVISIIFKFLYFSLLEKYRKLKSENEYYNKTFLKKQGGTTLIPNANNYNLQSFDAGKNWYAVDPKKDFDNFEIVILGTADSIYPGLLKHIEGIDKLTKYLQDQQLKKL
jgi:hypothetical protein